MRVRLTAVLRGLHPNLRVRLFRSDDPDKLGKEIKPPRDWPDTINVKFLEKKGFTVVRANLMGVIKGDVKK